MNLALVEFLLFRQCSQNNLPIWPNLDIAPKVNWFKFEQIWVKTEVARGRGKIAQFFTDFGSPMGVSRRKMPFEGSREMEN